MSTFTNITDAYVVIVKDSEGLSNIVCLDRPWFQKGDKVYYNNTEIKIIDVLETSELISVYQINAYLISKAGEKLNLKPIMSNIPTAEEFTKILLTEVAKCRGIRVTSSLVEEHFIKFAKLHVEAALKAASEGTFITSTGHGNVYHTENAKKSILNAYPPENIK